ncbi:hypothetical protein AQI88_39435 [Streptomyces cellostaticus]|uniref:Uncharacterized protein n=2 Tax=Streptomyces cellostaticus TaxID=67285 RepID=A0A117PSY1_9ACTN|nr:hypothetical protein AQI88_39435 [Streptomyces cellostaticus]
MFAGPVGTVVGGGVGGDVGSGIGEVIVDGIEDLFRMRRWLEGLFGRGRLHTANASTPGAPVWAEPEIPDEERAVLLVGILDDPMAREDEKYDAAWDLEFLSGPFVESSLARIIRAEDFTSVLAQHCAESLGGIWARAGRVDPDFMAEVRGPAKDEVFGILGVRAPHLLPPGP